MFMPEGKKYWVWLSSIPGLGAKKYTQLLEIFQTPENLWHASEKELNRLPFLNEAAVNKLTDRNLRDQVEVHLENIGRYRIKVISLDHPEYPGYLKNIYDPPIVLYVRGSLKQDRIVSVVGSRKATFYGLQTAEKISYDLAKRGITVASGMARGVDSYAHNGALNAGGRTLAVLGCGPDIVYPPENGALMEKIIESGAVISEFLPGFPPLPQNFPARNRIISGISLGVAVIEANERSGSLITANFALEQGREVFAVPGNVTSVNSKGTNKLIKEGAKMVTDIEDILEELKFFEISNTNTNPMEKESENDAKRNRLLAGLSPEEKTVARNLEGEALHIDSLAQKCGLSMKEINAILILLELQGIIEQLPGKFYKLRP